jgi:inward rectifier potassium channel
MAIIRPTHDAGLGEKYLDESKRLINKDGSFNLKRTGGLWQARNMYQWLIGLSWPTFLGLVLLLYLVTNCLFACAYLAVGIEQLSGINPEAGHFWSAFYFSSQTITTVGYGAIAPIGAGANMLAAFEAFAGLTGFALVTGLLYGRFSKPNAKFLFSNNALIAPYQGGKSLQFRLVNVRSNIMMEVEAHVLLMVLDKQNGHRRYYNLKLETKFIQFFPLNWTLVHLISEDSPLYNCTKQSLKDLDAELLVRIKGYDDSFGQTVQVRYSYKYNEIVHGARFLRVYESDADGNTHLSLNKIHDYEMVG